MPSYRSDMPESIASQIVDLTNRYAEPGDDLDSYLFAGSHQSETWRSAIVEVVDWLRTADDVELTNYQREMLADGLTAILAHN